MTRYKYDVYSTVKSYKLIATDYIIEQDINKDLEYDMYLPASKKGYFEKDRSGEGLSRYPSMLFFAGRQVGENKWELSPKGNDTEQYCFRVERGTTNKLRLYKFEVVKSKKKDSVKTIIADETEYPLDGAKGDYWYVRGDKLNGLNIVFTNSDGNKSCVKNIYYKDENGEIIKVKNVYYIDENGKNKNLLI